MKQTKRTKIDDDNINNREREIVINEMHNALPEFIDLNFDLCSCQTCHKHNHSCLKYAFTSGILNIDTMLSCDRCLEHFCDQCSTSCKFVSKKKPYVYKKQSKSEIAFISGLGFSSLLSKSNKNRKYDWDDLCLCVNCFRKEEGYFCCEDGYQDDNAIRDHQIIIIDEGLFCKHKDCRYHNSN